MKATALHTVSLPEIGKQLDICVSEDQKFEIRMKRSYLELLNKDKRKKDDKESTLLANELFFLGLIVGYNKLHNLGPNEPALFRSREELDDRLDKGQGLTKEQIDIIFDPNASFSQNIQKLFLPEAKENDDTAFNDNILHIWPNSYVAHCIELKNKMKLESSVLIKLRELSSMGTQPTIKFKFGIWNFPSKRRKLSHSFSKA